MQMYTMKRTTHTERELQVLAEERACQDDSQADIFCVGTVKSSALAVVAG